MTTEGTGDKLYAGKFKTVEELEKGYQNSATVYDENEKLKKQVAEATTTPADYINPSDVTLEENRVSELKARAKEAGMTQAQYEKFVRSDKARVDQNNTNFENAKKEVGEPTINTLKDYIAKQYPPELADSMLNTFIGNKSAREAALKHRDQVLNNSIPGMGKQAPPSGYNVSPEDVRKAYDAKEKDPHNPAKRQAYLNLLSQQANAKAS